MTRIHNIHKSSTGIISFTAQFIGMRSEQIFIIIDIDKLIIQAETRIGIIDNHSVKLVKGKHLLELDIKRPYHDVIENIEELRNII